MEHEKIILKHSKTDFLVGASGKETACQCKRHKRHSFSPWVGKIPWKRSWQHTSVHLPRESHGQIGALQATVQSSHTHSKTQVYTIL